MRIVATNTPKESLAAPRYRARSLYHITRKMHLGSLQPPWGSRGVQVSEDVLVPVWSVPVVALDQVIRFEENSYVDLCVDTF